MDDAPDVCDGSVLRCLTMYLATLVSATESSSGYGLETREDILNHDFEKISAGVHALAARLPTYLTLKEVKKRWGHGQEDVFPITQFEKIWGDMSMLPDVDCGYFVVPRLRGQQLKDPAQLDAWLRDGSADCLRTLCAWC